MNEQDFIKLYPWYQERPDRFHREDWYFFPEDEAEFEAKQANLTMPVPFLDLQIQKYMPRMAYGHDLFEHVQECDINGRWEENHEKGTNSYIGREEHAKA